MASAAPCCGACRHFDNTPAAREAAFPGLSIFSSAYASVCAEDGLCSCLDLYLSAADLCRHFAPRQTLIPAGHPAIPDKICTSSR